ncbi:hypothetical protein M407DRAFT_6233 [Tulasnella calospora MUT 4182]|uniref:Uncharacterized protein n=1 Tax=Tulasnella calospora MUT 4182 TaxID=1051891 RepID=A0A0C3QN56_9AGAM|nr:hypothetical protein M407DRAFT_6233 [Tulasnella calospora MUT 4182]
MFSFSSILSLWRKPAAASQTGASILDLPDELILDIAHQASPSSSASKPSSTSHQIDLPIDAPVSLPSDLASLSRTNRVFHTILAPVVLRDVHITSARRLRSLALVPADKLSLVKSLSIHLDFDFFIEFARSIDPSYRSFVKDPQHTTACDTANNTTYPSPSLIHILCSVLSSTSSLESFSIRLAKAQDRPSAWRNFAYRQTGLAFGRVFEETMQEVLAVNGRQVQSDSSHSAALLPRLKRVHLDAMEDIAPLLRNAPSLSTLSLRMLEGFETDSCLRLLDDIKSSASHLKHLALSAQSLAIPCTSGARDTSTGFDLVEEIGKACPVLEELDLRVKTYGHSTFEYLTTFSSSEYSDLAATLLNFPQLKAFHLPGNLLTQEQIDVLEAPPALVPSPAKDLLDHIAAHERDAVQAMTVVAPSLERVTWVRPNDAEGSPVSVQYDVPVTEDSGVTLPASSAAWEIPTNLCSSPSASERSLFFRPCSGREVLEFASDHPALTTAALMAVAVAAAGGVTLNGVASAGRGDVVLTAYSGVIVVGMVYGKIANGAKAAVRAADSASGRFAYMVTTEMSKRAQVFIF